MRRVSLIGAPIGALIMTPIGVVLTGLVIWGLSALLGARMTFRAGATIATFASFPKVWSILAAMLQASLLAPTNVNAVSLSPARFLDPVSSPVLVAFLGRLDVFVLWCTALIAIGVATIAGTSRGRAWIIAAVVWLLASFPSVIGPLATAVNR